MGGEISESTLRNVLPEPDDAAATLDVPDQEVARLAVEFDAIVDRLLIEMTAEVE